MSKYLFREVDLSKELIILLSIFNASKINHDLLDPLVDNNDLLAIGFMEWEIIQEKLIASAIKLRIIDDQFKKYNKNPHFPKIVVGKIKEGNNKSKELSFREACNKIVHAVNFISKTRSNKKPMHEIFFISKVYLEGAKEKTKWKAVLDIDKFVCDGLSLAKQYDEDWDISSR